MYSGNWKKFLLGILIVVLAISILVITWVLSEPRFALFSTLLAAIITLVAALVPSLLPLLTFQKSSSSTLIEQNQSERSKLIQLVDDYWIKGVLNNILYETGAIDLELGLASDAVVKTVEYEEYRTAQNIDIDRIFQDTDRELLILGAAGSGKTVTLLRLAQALLEVAKQKADIAVPVVINISSWQGQNFLQWLPTELVRIYPVKPAWLGRPNQNLFIELLKREKLILLLDGLDEVSENYRLDCVQKINDFCALFKETGIAVCSRKEDYEKLSVKLNFRGAILLQPLSDKTVTDYLAHEKLSGLRQVLDKDMTLKSMSHTPFLLNTMAIAYWDLPSVSLKLPLGQDGEMQRKEHLFDKYIARRIPKDGKYAPLYTKALLAKFAKRMESKKENSLNPDIADSEWLSITQRILYNIVFFLLYYAFMSITTRYAINYGLLKPLYPSWVVLTMKGYNQIHTSYMSMLLYLFVTRNKIFSIRGIFFLPFIVAFAFAYGSIVNYGVAVNPYRGFIGISIITALYTAPYLLGSLAILLVKSFFKAFVRPERGLQNKLIKILSDLGISFATVVSFVAIILFLTVLGNVFMPPYTIRRLLLKKILYWNRIIPDDVEDFLNYAAQHHILRKLGTSYIYRHRYLQEYFLAMPETLPSTFS